MRIAYFILMGGLVDCGGTAERSTTGAQQQGGGMPGVSGSGGAPEGTSGTGGSGNGGGGTGGAEPSACDTPVTFRLAAAESAPTRFCLGKPGSCGGGGAWLSLRDEAGEF